MSIEDHSWMYQGWNDNGCHSQEWVQNTNDFLDRAFSAAPNSEKFGVFCPCSDCGNKVRQRRAIMSMHLCKRGYMPGYTIWTKHGENPASEPTFEHTADGLDEMLANFSDALHANSAEAEPPADAMAASKEPLHAFTADFDDALHANSAEDEPPADAMAASKEPLHAFTADFGDALHANTAEDEPPADAVAASKEPLHAFTSVGKLTAVAHLMAIKSKHNLSGECINKLLDLFGDILPESHKMPKDLYECKSLLSGLKTPYVKIDACTNNCMIYNKEDSDKEKCDFCGESRYVCVEPTQQGHKRKPTAHRFCVHNLYCQHLLLHHLQIPLLNMLEPWVHLLKWKREQTLSRIANGVFHGHMHATTWWRHLLTS